MGRNKYLISPPRRLGFCSQPSAPLSLLAEMGEFLWRDEGNFVAKKKPVIIRMGEEGQKRPPKYAKKTEPEECWARYHTRTGDTCDVESLLFTPRRKYLVQCGNVKARAYAKDLDDKFVLLVGLSTPDVSKEMELFLKDLPGIYEDICRENASANEDLVLVLSIREGPTAKADVTEDEFNQILSETGFTSPLCLAIPYNDHQSRLAVCRSLGMGAAEDLYRYPPYCYAVSKEGIVLEFEGGFLSDLASECYPFTPDNYHLLMAQRDKLVQREGLSLEYLLSPSWRPPTPTSSSDDDDDDDEKPVVVVFEMTKPDGSPVSVPLSSLKDRVVGLYLCADGEIFDKLYEVYKEWNSKGKNFTVVLVYGPNACLPGFEKYQERINDKLSSLFKNDNDSSSHWFALPYKNKVASKLRCLLFRDFTDELVVVVPRDDDNQQPFVELDGRVLVTEYGLLAFPFTKANVRDAVMERLNALTLEDFLPASTKLTDPRGEEVLLSDVLEGKEKVLIYFTYVNDERSSSKLLPKWYEDLKRADGDGKFELILVNFGFRAHMAPVSVYPDPMPWPVILASRDILKTVQDRLAPGFYLSDPVFAAFRHGKVVSLYSFTRFPPLKSTAVFPTDGTLLEELKEYLNERHEHSLTESF